MFTASKRFAFGAALATSAALVLAACGSSDPLAEDPADGGTAEGGDTIVVGSQAYYSNEIIAEIYAQA
ncbi:MAG TPA: glycine/betaine ABC transporter, partial [Microbacterium sp.]|nr:glycine/betaine ABC transporter [Microbacterium sp.]